jgi:hypothetical protein
MGPNPVPGQIRKLRANWSIEAAQDLSIWHGNESNMSYWKNCTFIGPNKFYNIDFDFVTRNIENVYGIEIVSLVKSDDKYKVAECINRENNLVVFAMMLLVNGGLSCNIATNGEEYWVDLGDPRYPPNLKARLTNYDQQLIVEAIGKFVDTGACRTITDILVEKMQIEISTEINTEIIKQIQQLKYGK